MDEALHVTLARWGNFYLIHNAWDTVTYLTVSAIRRGAPGSEREPPRRSASGAKGRRRR